MNNKEIVLSYAQEMEDVILYNLFREEEYVSYIDVGANDSFYLNVTRLMYDKGMASGINIDPLEKCIESYADRTRDINICAGCGRESQSSASLYYDKDNSTGASFIMNSYLKKHESNQQSVPIVSLCDVISKNRSRLSEVGFLKIDTEGFELQVLEGMDFNAWKPGVVVIEAGPLNIKEPWEVILNNNNYNCIYYHRGNRYYIENTQKKLKERFLPVERLAEKYDVFIPYKRYLQQKDMYENSTSWKMTRPIRKMTEIIKK